MDNKSNIAVIRPSEGQTPHARLLKPGEGSLLGKEIDRDPIPFVPAFDLLEAAEAQLSPAQVAAIAVALAELLPQEETVLGNWGNLARINAVSNRL